MVHFRNKHYFRIICIYSRFFLPQTIPCGNNCSPNPSKIDNIIKGQLMKYSRYALLAALLTSTTAYADSAAYIGISYTFDGEVGLSAKILSDDEEDSVVAAVGATYYPFSQNKFGLDIGAGYVFDDAAALIGWDFLQNRVQGSIGWADTENDKNNTPAATPAPFSSSELEAIIPATDS